MNSHIVLKWTDVQCWSIFYLATTNVLSWVIVELWSFNKQGKCPHIYQCFPTVPQQIHFLSHIKDLLKWFRDSAHILCFVYYTYSYTVHWRKHLFDITIFTNSILTGYTVPQIRIVIFRYRSSRNLSDITDLVEHCRTFFWKINGLFFPEKKIRGKLSLLNGQ